MYASLSLELFMHSLLVLFHGKNILEKKNQKKKTLNYIKDRTVGMCMAKHYRILATFTFIASIQYKGII